MMTKKHVEISTRLWGQVSYVTLIKESILSTMIQYDTKLQSRRNKKGITMIRFGFLLSTTTLLLSSSSAFLPPANSAVVRKFRNQIISLSGVMDPKEGEEVTTTLLGGRRVFLESTGSMAFFSAIMLVPGSAANALVKGNAPPPKKSAADKPKCTNVEECQALAEKRDQERREEEEQGPPPKVTASGVRYRDLEDGSGKEIKDGDDVEIWYKVLKLGKRSYDGLSGEGTVVFSRGRFLFRAIFFFP